MRSSTIGTMALAFAGLCGMLASDSASAQEKAKTLKVGDKAPAFTSVDDQGKAWKSSDVIGQKVVVLYFYPADLTGVQDSAHRAFAYLSLSRASEQQRFRRIRDTSDSCRDATGSL